MSAPRPASDPAARRPRLLAPDRERDLRARLCARDERALAELVDVATPWLLGMVQGMLHDADDAQDVVIDSFRLAWEHVQPVEREPTPLVPWLLRIARNRALDRLRAEKRRQVRQGTVARDAETRTVPLEPNEAAVPGWHVHQAVHRALGDLPDEQAAVVRLAYFEGLTQSEIAEQLTVPLGTVKTRLRLAAGKLRTALQPLQEWIR